MNTHTIAVTLGLCVAGVYGLAPYVVGIRGVTPTRRKAAVAPLPSSFHSSTFELTRLVSFRALGTVFLTAFLIARDQNAALIGDRGLAPAKQMLDNTAHLQPWVERPVSLLYWVKDRDRGLDGYLHALAVAGALLSLVPVLVPRYAVAPLWMGLWLLYSTIDTCGGPFYSFMWESQLLETGFLAAMTAPLWIGGQAAPAWFSVSVHRWLLFRIMMGAGLIKVRGDSCWKVWEAHPTQPSCLEFHYETQPVPGPLAPYLHFLPVWVHRGGTWTNHVVELVAPWLLLLPPITRRLRGLGVLGGLLQLAFQSMLMASGNLSFLNVLTCVPALWCFDDAFFGAAALGAAAASAAPKSLRGKIVRHAWYVAVAAALTALSVRVVRNLCSDQQVMNSTFGSVWRLVNTYGAFGTVGRERHEIIVSAASTLDAPAHETEWQEYEFKVKPGATGRSLPFIVPYHYRLDWCVWLLALQTMYQPPTVPQRYPSWWYRFLLRLLQNDPVTTSLLAHNPFDGRPPPAGLKVERYRYTFSNPYRPHGEGEAAATGGKEGRMVWHREKIGDVFPGTPVITADMLRDFA